MSRLLYVDCIAGVAGDMLLAALLDAGAPLEAVRAGLDPLCIGGLTIAAERTERHGIGARRVDVTTPCDESHRDWAAVRELVDGARMSPRARSRAHAVFRALAQAEGEIHGVRPDQVQFHEVGAVDAIADVCGIAIALEELDIDRIACSPLPVARGFVDAAHGRLPLPAPATVRLLRDAPVLGVDVGVELVTPTGAAVVAALAEEFGPLPAMTLRAVGYGAGRRDMAALPNLVRVMIGDVAPEPVASRRAAILLESNLDDLLPELVPDAADACRAAGALDVWTAPVHMKQGRPGVVLSAIARHDREAAVADAMLRQTTTLGVRVTEVSRWELERTHRTVDVDGQRVAVKVGWLDGVPVNVAPEHGDVARAAARLGRAAKAVWADAFTAAHREVSGG